MSKSVKYLLIIMVFCIIFMIIIAKFEIAMLFGVIAVILGLKAQKLHKQQKIQ